MPIFTKKFIVGVVTLAVLVAIAGYFIYALRPVSANANSVVFTVNQGEGSGTIVSDLASAHLIRSSFAARFFSIVSGAAFHLQPGLYKLSGAMSTPTILDTLTNSLNREVSVTIPEGSNIFQVDAILANALVIRAGDLINFKAEGNLEGRLFPDTYRFFIGSDVKDVVQKFLDNYAGKAAPLLGNNTSTAEKDLILASIVDKEVPDLTDQEIVAGILLKRIAAGVPLDVDASICYAKFLAKPTSTAAGCYPLTPLDYKADSAYNTYLYKGLPPGPIGNPGISAIQATVSPKSSPYWYYLSDPLTGKTIFATTLDEQNANRVKYLKSD